MVPGHCSAATQQEARELADVETHGRDFRFAIHPVAGFMPGQRGPIRFSRTAEAARHAWHQ